MTDIIQNLSVMINSFTDSVNSLNYTLSMVREEVVKTRNSIDSVHGMTNKIVYMSSNLSEGLIHTNEVMTSLQQAIETVNSVVNNPRLMNAIETIKDASSTLDYL